MIHIAVTYLRQHHLKLVLPINFYLFDVALHNVGAENMTDDFVGRVLLFLIFDVGLQLFYLDWIKSYDGLFFSARRYYWGLHT